MEALEQRPLIYDPADVLHAGVFIMLDRDGSLAVYCGYFRSEDEPREETVVQDAEGAGVMGQGGGAGGSRWQASVSSGGGTVINSGGQPIGTDITDDEEDGELKPLPERLVMELAAHRTVALREPVGRSPDLALTLLLLKLVTDTLRTSSASGSSLEASVRHIYISAQAPDLKASIAAALVDERHVAWEADLPLGDDADSRFCKSLADASSRRLADVTGLQATCAILFHCMQCTEKCIAIRLTNFAAGGGLSCYG